jgi:hypothetical protein
MTKLRCVAVRMCRMCLKKGNIQCKWTKICLESEENDRYSRKGGVDQETHSG